MKKLMTSLVAASVLLLPVAGHHASAATKTPTYTLPSVTNATVAKQLKEGTYIYKRSDGKKIKMGDTFGTLRTTYGDPKFFTTNRTAKISNFTATYGYSTTPVKFAGDVSKGLYNFDTAPIEMMVFNYNNKYTLNTIQKVYGEAPLIKKMSDVQYNYYYSNGFYLTYYKVDGVLKLNSMTYYKLLNN